MAMQLMSYDIVDQAVTNFFVGFGFALLNVIICYFAPAVPRFITVLSWKNRSRALLIAYLIALIIQMATSPFFRSMLHSVYTELAWSPYQALFNVAGVIVIDLIVGLWRGARRGAQAGREQFDALKDRAIDAFDGVETPVAVTPEQRAAQIDREQARAEAEAQTAADRKKRVDDRLGKY